MRQLIRSEEWEREECKKKLRRQASCMLKLTGWFDGEIQGSWGAGRKGECVLMR